MSTYMFVDACCSLNVCTVCPSHANVLQCQMTMNQIKACRGVRFSPWPAAAHWPVLNRFKPYPSTAFHLHLLLKATDQRAHKLTDRQADRSHMVRSLSMAGGSLQRALKATPLSHGQQTEGGKMKETRRKIMRKEERQVEWMQCL